MKWYTLISFLMKDRAKNDSVLIIQNPGPIYKRLSDCLTADWLTSSYDAQ